MPRYNLTVPVTSAGIARIARARKAGATIRFMMEADVGSQLDWHEDIVAEATLNGVCYEIFADGKTVRMDGAR